MTSILHTRYVPPHIHPPWGAALPAHSWPGPTRKGVVGEMGAGSGVDYGCRETHLSSRSRPGERWTVWRAVSAAWCGRSSFTRAPLYASYSLADPSPALGAHGGEGVSNHVLQVAPLRQPARGAAFARQNATTPVPNRHRTQQRHATQVCSKWVRPSRASKHVARAVQGGGTISERHCRNTRRYRSLRSRARPLCAAP